MKIAILVDGAFYRKTAKRLWGEKTPEARAEELHKYCRRHLKKAVSSPGTNKVRYQNDNDIDLYRIFYYDCPPSERQIIHPLTHKHQIFKKSDLYKWTNSFFNSLREKRKVALRLGELSDDHAYYSLDKDSIKKLFNNKITLDDITEENFILHEMVQKGVDMRIGLDISSMAYKKQVERMILISGDSDFVPAAKLARREGIDFILDPLHSHIRPDLSEHIDGLWSCFAKNKMVKNGDVEEIIIADPQKEKDF